MADTAQTGGQFAVAYLTAMYNGDPVTATLLVRDLPVAEHHAAFAAMAGSLLGVVHALETMGWEGMATDLLRDTGIAVARQEPT
jgi:hypothetical protein